ncbi:MAG: hypothetical protein KAI08_12860 [Bacteroidales bacterium]|nr:hypothetical protein [Bacteroidales bacterium]
MPKKPLPIVWFVDESRLPDDDPENLPAEDKTKKSKIKKITEAVEKFEKEELTLKWLREEIDRIIN